VALRLATQAVEATGGRDAGLLDTLAAAEAEAGIFDRAVTHAQQAAELAAAANQLELGQRIRDRARLYAAGKPYRDPPQGEGNAGSRVAQPMGRTSP
jgi:hypothetical protein